MSKSAEQYVEKQMKRILSLYDDKRVELEKAIADGRSIAYMIRWSNVILHFEEKAARLTRIINGAEKTGDLLAAIKLELSICTDQLLTDYYRSGSTCQLANAVEAEKRAAVCDLITSMKEWVRDLESDG